MSLVSKTVYNLKWWFRQQQMTNLKKKRIIMTNDFHDFRFFLFEVKKV